MASPSDKKPNSGSLRDTYSVIRGWYQANIDKHIDNGDEYRKASAPLVRALPTDSAVSDVEIIAVFKEVIAGRLEWAYGAKKSGGDKIPGYAKAALETLGRDYNLTSEETLQLQKSVLWPFIKG